MDYKMNQFGLCSLVGIVDNNDFNRRQVTFSSVAFTLTDVNIIIKLCGIWRLIIFQEFPLRSSHMDIF